MVIRLQCFESQVDGIKQVLFAESIPAVRSEFSAVRGPMRKTSLKVFVSAEMPGREHWEVGYQGALGKG